MTATLKRIWVNEFDGEKELRTDFTNDRHRMVSIKQPHGAEQVSEALYRLAELIAADVRNKNL